jgi:hypothetical protein
MGTEASDAGIDDVIRREVAVFLERLPFETRVQLKSTSVWSAQLEESARERVRSLRSAEARRRFLRRYMLRAVFRELFERAEFPVEEPWLLDQAIEVAQQVLAGLDRQFKPRFGDCVAEVGAAPGFGWEGLIQLEKQRGDGKQIIDPRGLLRTIVFGYVLREVDEAMRTVSPGTRAHHHLVKKYERELAGEELTEAERHERAMRLADKECERLGRFFTRVAAEGAIERVEDPGDSYARVFAYDLVRMVDDVVGLDVTTSTDGVGIRFTKTDRRAWRIFKAANLHGADIDWEKYGIKPHNGSQQLQALFRKLAAVLGDWRL